MVKQALVVIRENLFKDKYFEGFLPAHEYDFISVILKNFLYYPRGEELEHNHDLQQIIPYVLILNPQKKQVFIYRRANNEKYSEKRLRNKWSFGVGGHIEKQDNNNPIKSAMMRELREEIKMKNYPIPKIVGYINDDKGDVEKVHFGILAVAETNEEIMLGDDEIAEGRFMSVDEIEKLFANYENDIEGWTKISWPFVKKYLFS